MRAHKMRETHEFALTAGGEARGGTGLGASFSTAKGKYGNLKMGNGHRDWVLPAKSEVPRGFQVVNDNRSHVSVGSSTRYMLAAGRFGEAPELQQRTMSKQRFDDGITSIGEQMKLNPGAGRAASARRAGDSHTHTHARCPDAKRLKVMKEPLPVKLMKERLSVQG